MRDEEELGAHRVAAHEEGVRDEAVCVLRTHCATNEEPAASPDTCSALRSASRSPPRCCTWRTLATTACANSLPLFTCTRWPLSRVMRRASTNQTAVGAGRLRAAHSSVAFARSGTGSSLYAPGSGYIFKSFEKVFKKYLSIYYLNIFYKSIQYLNLEYVFEKAFSIYI